MQLLSSGPAKKARGEGAVTSGAEPVTELAEATFAFFLPHLHAHRWAFAHASHGPKNVEVEAAIRDRGKAHCCTFYRENGHNFILRPFHAWVFKRAIEQERKVYYTSERRFPMPCLDIDVHESWQTLEDAKLAAQKIDDVFTTHFGRTVIFWGQSARGIHGYFLVNNWLRPRDANKLFLSLTGEMREQLKEWLPHLEGQDRVDLEVKGTISWTDDNGKFYGGTYCTLPIHDDWSAAKLLVFKRLPRLGIPKLKALLAKLQKKRQRRCDIDRTTAVRAERRRQGKADGMCPDSSPRSSLRPSGQGLLGETIEHLPNRLSAARKLLQERAGDDCQRRSQIAGLDELRAEPDSHVRQLTALLAFARHLKGVPDVGEALAFIKAERLYTGEWAQNEQRRERRVRSILRFLSRTFDAKKCSRGHIDLDLYMKWASMKYPNGAGTLSIGFIAIALALCEFMLVADPNADGSLPYERAKALWKSLYRERLIPIAWNKSKWGRFRELAEKENIIRTNGEYGPGRALKWTIGPAFPVEE